MRRLLFERICDRLRERVPELRHYNLWNENMGAIERGPIFDTPAVFVEFDPVTFTHQGRGIPRGTITLTLHVITKYVPLTPARSSYAPQGLEHLDLLERIEEALTGFAGDGFSPLLLSSAELDHNHAELQDHRERFVTSVAYPDDFGQVARGQRRHQTPLAVLVNESV